MEQTSERFTKPKLRAKKKKKLKFELSCARYAYKKALKNQYKAFEELSRASWYSPKGTIRPTQEELDRVSQADTKSDLVEALIHPDELFRKWAKAKYHSFACYELIQQLRVQLYGR